MAVWTTKDGRTMLMSEMGDSHLRNSIAMMQRRVKEIQLEYAACASCGFQGDGAIAAQDAALSSLENVMEEADELLSLLEAEESRRRFCRGQDKV